MDGKHLMRFRGEKWSGFQFSQIYSDLVWGSKLFEALSRIVESYDDNNDNENVAIKMNSRFFKGRRDYSNSLFKMLNVGEICRS